ncbi:MAG: DUF302 domain-containing protein [Gammaproteobacteria bacterium]|nr:DUF302 domain-containing protein [Gammaproteobacteria bacterium]
MVIGNWLYVRAQGAILAVVVAGLWLAGVGLASGEGVPGQEAAAAEGRIYQRQFTAPELAPIYEAVHIGLENSRFFVIQELDIGKNLARNAARWGEDYNRNRFEQVRGMVICNPWYANQLLNRDPRLMVLCPITLTFLYRKEVGIVLYERLRPAGVGSPAEELLREMDETVIVAVEKATPGGESLYGPRPGDFPGGTSEEPP